MKNSGFGGDKYYLVKGHTTMATTTVINFDSLSTDAKAQLILEAELRSEGMNPSSLTKEQVDKIKKSLPMIKAEISELRDAVSQAPGTENLTIAQMDAILVQSGKPAAFKNAVSELSHDGVLVITDGSTKLGNFISSCELATKKMENIVASSENKNASAISVPTNSDIEALKSSTSTKVSSSTPVSSVQALYAEQIVATPSSVSRTAVLAARSTTTETTTETAASGVTQTTNNVTNNTLIAVQVNNYFGKSVSPIANETPTTATNARNSVDANKKTITGTDRALFGAVIAGSLITGLSSYNSGGKTQDNINTNIDPLVSKNVSTEPNTNANIDIVQQSDNTPREQQTPTSQSDTRIVGTAYDDDGNLNPGWTLDEFNNPVKTDANFVEPATQASAAQSRAAAAPQPVAFSSAPDWRFRIKLAPESNYLYNAPDPGILAPLKGKGVIFPYTPTISVAYTAKYDTNAIAHSNYNVYTYQGSAVENITVTGDFTAQDITEANYMLAVIHFCRSATKMFYGQDKFRGTPPPLLYLSGLGEYQFDNHPVVLTNFTYTLPSDVDYINAYPNGGTTGINGASLTPFQAPTLGREFGKIGGFVNEKINQLLGRAIPQVSKQSATPSYKSNNTTRVPTKLSISLTFNPMITRYAVSNKFSLTDYASGKLLQGSKNPGNGGGMW